MARRLWTRNEMILALELYHKLPFGRLNHSTPEVKALAALIDRTPNSIALRLVNYASCDPFITGSGRKGMDGGYDKCIPYWEEFQNNTDSLLTQAAEIRAKIANKTLEEELNLLPEDFTGKVKEAVIKQRIGQYAFRDMVLANYNNHCAMTGISIPQLLVASHIIPWAEDEHQRLNPANGICLSPLYDKAFDLGYIGINPIDYTIMLSRELKSYHAQDFYDKHFKAIEHQQLRLPSRCAPQPEFLEYHLEHIFSRHE